MAAWKPFNEFLDYRKEGPFVEVRWKPEVAAVRQKQEYDMAFTADELRKLQTELKGGA